MDDTDVIDDESDESPDEEEIEGVNPVDLGLVAWRDLKHRGGSVDAPGRAKEIY